MDINTAIKWGMTLYNDILEMEGESVPVYIWDNNDEEYEDGLELPYGARLAFVIEHGKLKLADRR